MKKLKSKNKQKKISFLWKLILNKKIYRNIFLILFIFVIGGFGGIILDRSLTRLCLKSNFDKIRWPQWICQKDGVTTIIENHPTEIINKDDAIQKAVAKLTPMTLGIVTKKIPTLSSRVKTNIQILTEGTGFIVAADGIIVTTSDLIPEKADQILVYRDTGSSMPAELIKRDLDNNLALIKINGTNLPVVSFKEDGEVRLGQTVILLAIDVRQSLPQKFVNLGFIREKYQNIITCSIRENQLANGSPLIDLEGNVVGLNVVDQNQNINIVPTIYIKNLINQ